jgi:diguanylate cyclase
VAEAIRMKVSKLRLMRRRDNRMLPALTVSIGVASLRDGDADPDAVIHRADGALYRSKQEGRNKVTRA